MTATQQQTPGFLNAAPDNWKLAIAVGLAVSILAGALLPVAVSFWVIGAMVAMVAASFVVNGFRKHYYGGLLVSPAIAVLFVMNIFPPAVVARPFLFRLSEQPADHALYRPRQLFKTSDR
jgi:multiple sugar transport system permease protein